MLKNNCENCKNFQFINEYPIFGTCEMNKIIFKLWDKDARNISCPKWTSKEEKLN